MLRVNCVIFTIHWKTAPYKIFNTRCIWTWSLILIRFSQISNSHRSMHWIDERSPSTLPFCPSLLTTFVFFYMILVSKLYCKSLLWFPTSSSNTLNLPRNSYSDIYLSSFLSATPLSIISATYHVLTQCSRRYSVFAFPLNVTYFPLSVPLHLSKLCVYINYVYSTVPRCARLLPVYRVNAD